MDGLAAPAHQLKNPTQPAATLLTHFEHAVRFLFQKNERTDERDEEWLVGCVERDVQKDVVLARYDRRHHFVAERRFVTASTMALAIRRSAGVIPCERRMSSAVLFPRGIFSYVFFAVLFFAVAFMRQIVTPTCR